MSQVLAVHHKTDRRGLFKKTAHRAEGHCSRNLWGSNTLWETVEGKRFL